MFDISLIENSLTFLKKKRLALYIFITAAISVQAYPSCSKVLELKDLNRSEYSVKEPTKWFKTSQKPIGVILLLHGLNLRPSKMDPLATHFQSSGYDVLRAALAGHRGSLTEQKKVSSKQWLEQMQQHACLVEQRSEELGKAPKFLSAFSLGSLVAMAWMAQKQQPFFKAQLLLAPANFAHWYGSITKTLFFLKDSFSLPSKNIKQYRSQDSTSLAAYRSMEELRDVVYAADKSVHNIPTLVFLDPKDELVSLKKLELFKKKFTLDQWKIETITDSEPTLKKSFHHLIIDEPSLGSHHWQELKALSIRHFGH